MENTDLPVMRKYRHYKGNDYLLITITNVDTDREGFEPTAVYYSLSENKMYSRSLAKFKEKFTLIDAEEYVVSILAQNGTTFAVGTELGCIRKPLISAEIPEALLTAFHRDIAFDL